MNKTPNQVLIAFEDGFAAVGRIAYGWANVEVATLECLIAFMRMPEKESRALTAGQRYQDHVKLIKDLAAAKNLDKIRKKAIEDTFRKCSLLKQSRDLIAHKRWHLNDNLDVIFDVGATAKHSPHWEETKLSIDAIKHIGAHCVLAASFISSHLTPLITDQEMDQASFPILKAWQETPILRPHTQDVRERNSQ